MASHAGPGMEAFFLPGHAGDLFSLYRPARDGDGMRRALLIVPPFAEELNKSRRMLTLLAERLAEEGVGVLITDLYGTGDSEGDFGDADWEIWLEDLQVAADWLLHRGCGELSMLGLRLGALLLGDFLARPQRPRRAILWQPATRGQAALTHFLRLRLAASMLDDRREKETTARLRDDLDRGRSLEVAGYTLSPGLANAIDAADILAADWTSVTRMDWIEITNRNADSLSPAAATTIDTLIKRGVNISGSVIRGEPFWTTPEIATVPALIDATVDLYRAL